MADFTGMNRHSPVNAWLGQAWGLVEDYGFYVIGLGVVAYVASLKLTEWQVARERAALKAQKEDPTGAYADRKAALDAKRTAALAKRYDDERMKELQRASREEAEQAEAKKRAEKIERYDNLMTGKSNKKTSGLSGWRDEGGGGGGGGRPSWAKRRPACGPKGG